MTTTDHPFGEQLMPPEELSICFGGGDFERVGQNMLRIMRDHGGLEPDMRVLDVGCGIGRIAYALADFLTPKGSYDGFDTFLSGIEWANKAYGAVLPNFNFQHVNVFNGLYNPYGTTRASEFVFPHDDDSFDFVVLNSVFTHMRPDDVMGYFRQIHRVLKVGGIAFISWFFMTPETWQAVQGGTARQDIRHQFGKFYVQDVESPEDAVAYDESFIRAMYAGNGFEIVDVLMGSWRGRQARNYQDIVLARKAGE